MKKRFLSVLCAVLIAGSTSAFAADPAPQDPVVWMDDGEKALSYFGAGAIEQDTASPKFVLLLRFENFGSSDAYVLTSYKINVYQNGVALRPAVSTQQDAVLLAANSGTPSRDGTPVDFARVYALQDLSSDVTIEVSDALASDPAQVFSYSFGDAVGSETETEAIDWQARYEDLLVKYEALESEYNDLLK